MGTLRVPLGVSCIPLIPGWSVGVCRLGDGAMTVRNFKDLIAWQQAMELVDHLYEATKDFPPDERFGLTNQVRRAAVSARSNIAEWQGRAGSPDLLRCLSIAYGSLQEVETQLLIAKRLGHLDERFEVGLSAFTNEVARLLNGLMNSLSRVEASSNPPPAGD